MMTLSELRIRRIRSGCMRCLVVAALLLSCVAGSTIGLASDEPVALFDLASESSSQPAESGPSSPVLEAKAAPLPSGKQDLQQQKEQRFRELKRQIEILDQLFPTGPEKVTSPQEPKTEEQSDRVVPSPDETPDHREFAPLPNAPRKTLPNANSRPLAPQTIPATSRPEVPTKPHHSGDPQLVVEGTIDRFALATSLFGTGQVETCLDVLRHTDVSSLPREDQIWAMYMQACCHRKCGRLDEARQWYRRILAEKDADWVGQLASWWLDAIDAKKQLQSDVDRLKETLTAWEEEIDQLAKRTAAAGIDK